MINNCGNKTSEWLNQNIVAKLVENGPMGLFVLSLPDEKYLYANHSFLNSVGFEWEQLSGRTGEEIGLLPVEEHENIKKWQSDDTRVHYEIKLRHKTGRDIYLYGQTEISEFDGQLCMINFTQDITQYKLAQNQLVEAEFKIQQTQKMASLGKVAGGIAHDFNNMLTVVAGYTNVISRNLPAEHEVQVDLAAIEKIVERATLLTQHLLDFSSRQVSKPQEIYLDYVIQETVSNKAPLLGEQIKYHLDLTTSSDLVFIEPERLKQVILNLMLNARDAMSEGGLLKIATYRAKAESTPTNKNSEEWLVLEVSDTGTGMPPEVVDHIFEPFFTTKGPGKGIGLGLATVYGIIQQNKGFLTVKTAPGSGTTFKVYLPAYQAKATKEENKVPVLSKPQREATVLVVEDEDMVRNLTLRILSKSGFHVLEAPDSDTAFEMCRKHKIDLLLTDVIMPGMNGNVLATELVKMKPDLKVLFMSGYTDGLLPSRNSLPFIQKPFTPNDLIQKINQVLTEASF